MADADDTDTKIKKFCNWQGWQDFHRRTIHTMIELIKIGTDEGLYRNINLSVVEEIGLVRLEDTINIAAPTGGFFVAAMIDTGAGGRRRDVGHGGRQGNQHQL